LYLAPADCAGVEKDATSKKAPARAKSFFNESTNSDSSTLCLTDF